VFRCRTERHRAVQMQLCQALCLACGKAHVNNMGQGSVRGTRDYTAQCLHFLPSSMLRSTGLPFSVPWHTAEASRGNLECNLRVGLACPNELPRSQQLAGCCLAPRSPPASAGPGPAWVLCLRALFSVAASQCLLWLHLPLGQPSMPAEQSPCQ
jgi:hypothetical protein